ncbi:MAG: polymer-forming cytoskeletal protein [Pseudomonadota bacterium]
MRQVRVSARPSVQPAANDVPLVLGPDIRILGCFETTGELEIHGEIEGEVRAQNITLGRRGRLSGTAVAERVTVYGIVEDGFIFANRIVLGESCDVTGELYYKALDIQSGSLFEGKSRRHDDPKSLAPEAP